MAAAARATSLGRKLRLLFVAWLSPKLLYPLYLLKTGSSTTVGGAMSHDELDWNLLSPVCTGVRCLKALAVVNRGESVIYMAQPQQLSHECCPRTSEHSRCYSITTDMKA